MTEELKSQVDDMKDFAQQAKLESKIKGRALKHKAEIKLVEATGHKLSTQEEITGVKQIARDETHTAEDKMKQAALEVKMKTRDAKVAIDESATKQKLDDAVIKTGDALEDAKDKLVDAFTPATKVVEAESTRGVDITHIEGGTNQSVVKNKKKQAKRAARDDEREKERKRVELVKSAKAKAASVKASASETAASVGAVLKQTADKAGVVLGKAALGLKDKLDEYSDDRPREKVTPRVSDNGINISSVQNARNDELLAKEARVQELQKAQAPTLGEKAKASIVGAVDSIKEAYTEATTDAPKPIFVAKTSSKGVDISHLENAANADLAKKEQERLDAEKLAATQREKAVIETQLVDPLKAEATDANDTLKAKMSALGHSVSQAAHKLSDKVVATYNDLAHPVPLDVHEKTSERGIDTTSIASADNDRIGEEIKQRNSILPATTKETPVEEHKEPLKDTVIRKTLDAGVATKELGEAVAAKVEYVANDAKYHAKIAAAEADIAAQELKEKAAVKSTELKTSAVATADKVQASVSEAGYKAQDAFTDVKLGAQEKYENVKEKLAPNVDVEAKPDLDRVNTLPILPTASPITPGNFETFRANP
jgi:hypothetical protein